MDEFKEKWKKDKRYQTKIKLVVYTILVIAISVYAITHNNNNNEPLTNDKLNEIINKEEKQKETNYKINIPTNYEYQINVKINDIEYQYTGTKNNETITINKITENTIENYLYQNNNYYKEELGNYILVTKEQIFDEVEYKYLNLETINTYLTKATNLDNQYIVYIKDIILGEDNNSYITITINNENIIVDYTMLEKYFNSNVDSYIVNIKLKEIE